MTDALLDPAPWRFCVAPMLDWTDRHCRFFHRLMSRRARLYTEMVTAGAILHGDSGRLLGFSPAEHPVALQLGGSDPEDLAKAVEMAEPFGYDEYNLNCGCPSERVQRGAFGACLMKEPGLVAECVRAMRSATGRPVTVKHRIGVDDRTDYGFVRDFVGTVREAGCRVFVVHARSAWLKGLSPRENREKPPLHPEVAFRLKSEFPDTLFLLNGEIESLAEGRDWIDKGIDGVMMGRAVYRDPWMLREADPVFWGEEGPEVTRRDVVRTVTAYLENYAARHPEDDLQSVRASARHMMGLVLGLPRARLWRQFLSNPTEVKRCGPRLMEAAWAQVYGTQPARSD